jgi:hypothetical protein
MTDARHDLYRETKAAEALRANFADIIGDEEETAADLVEGQTDLNEAIDTVVEQLVRYTAHVHGLNEYIDKLTARKGRLLQSIDNMRTALAAAMEQAGRKKIDHPVVTLSLRRVAPSVTVTDEAAIPSKFFKPQEPKLDKRAVLAALKDKEDVPGATLNNGGQTLALSWS